MAAKDKKTKANNSPLLSSNKRAVRNYEISEKLEAGIVLKGSEVKSLRRRQAELDGAYAVMHNGELFLHQMHVAPYEQSGVFGHEPKAIRKLLLHRRELEKLSGKLATKGYTMIPIRLYLKKGVIKVELGLGKHKAKHDKRQDIKRDIAKREARDAVAKVRTRR